MAVRVINAVIHGFEKEQHTIGIPDAQIVKRPILLDVTLQPVILLVDGIKKLLGKRGSNLSWGRFKDDMREGQFPTAFRDGVTLNPGIDVDANFLALTHLAMDEITNQAKESRLATGSKILFSLYQNEEGGTQGLLIAMIKQRGGITLDENYVPQGVEQIDMSKLSHAADINCDDFLLSLREENDDEEEGFESGPYLSFISHRDTDDAAAYFITALGCTLFRSSKKSTSLVIEAAQKFCKANDDLKPYAQEAKEKVCSYLKERMESGQVATLDEIKAAAASAVPANLIHHFEGFVEVLNGQDYRIPSDFNVDESSLKKYSTIVLSDDDLKIKFEKSDFGVTEDDKIQYNQEQGYLRIKLSEKQKAQLNQYV